MPLIDLPIKPDGCLVDVAIHVGEGRYQALLQAGLMPPQRFQGIGLIDPGASNTVIDQSVVQFLGLQSIGVAPTFTSTTGSIPHLCRLYDISVWFPQAPTLVQSQPGAHPVHLTLPVSEADFSASGFHALIGRDILARGVFIYNGLAGRFTLAF
jgi:hypothetical protein